MEPRNAKAAAIDIGTNSIKVAVVHTDEAGVPHVVREFSVNARLGEGVDENKQISEESSARAIKAIEKCIAVCVQSGVDKNIRIVATSAMRDAKNSSKIAGLVKENFGFDLEIISEDEECRLTYSSVAKDPLLGKFKQPQMTVDVGGGSTEFSYGSGHELNNFLSVSIGAVRLMERMLDFPQPNPGQIEAASKYVTNMLANEITGFTIERVIGIGGSIINLARIWNEIPIDKTDEAHGCILTKENLNQSVEGMAALSPEKRKTLVGLEPERSDIIIAGAIIFESILNVLGKNELVVSTKGLRHGVIYEMLANMK